MTMDENAAVFLKMRTGNGLASRTIRVEGRGPQDDVLAGCPIFATVSSSLGWAIAQSAIRFPIPRQA
jgi:hypothetical protein